MLTTDPTAKKISKGIATSIGNLRLQGQYFQSSYAVSTVYYNAKKISQKANVIRKLEQIRDSSIFLRNRKNT